MGTIAPIFKTSIFCKAAARAAGYRLCADELFVRLCGREKSGADRAFLFAGGISAAGWPGGAGLNRAGAGKGAERLAPLWADLLAAADQ